MALNVKKSKGVCHIKIDDELTIYTAALIKEELLEYWTEHDEFEISLEQVSDFDTAGLQLLLMFHKEAEKHKKELRLVNHRTSVIEVLELLKLTGHFGDPIVMSSEE